MQKLDHKKSFYEKKNSEEGNLHRFSVIYESFSAKFGLTNKPLLSVSNSCPQN